MNRKLQRDEQSFLKVYKKYTYSYAEDRQKLLILLFDFVSMCMCYIKSYITI